METRTCTYCGVVIEAAGIDYRNHLFCSDECCEAFEDELLVRAAPDLDDLDDEEPLDVDFDLDAESFDLDSGGDLDDDDFQDFVG